MANNSLLESAKTNLSIIESTLGKKLNTEINNENSTIGKLKAQISTGEVTNTKTKEVVNSITIPSEIIDAFAAPIADKIDDSTISKYSKTAWVQQTLTQIVSAVRSIPTIKKNGYTITYNELPLTISGIGSISAKVTWSKNGNNYETELTWENFSQKTLQTYFDTLKQLNNDLWKEFAKELLKDSVKVVKALYGIDENQNLLKQVFSNSILKKATKNQIKSEVQKYIKKISSNDKEILNLIKQYETVIKKYTALETAINKNKDTDKYVQDFLKACNNIENALKITPSTLPDDTPIGLDYNSNKTILTVSSSYGSKLSSSDYNAKVQKIDATSLISPIEIIGNTKANTILGGIGADILRGGSGKDSIYGGNGNDSLYGDADNDKLFGEIGNDTLIGGKGNDTLSGGNGDDVFYYSNGDGNDVITDYTYGQDIIKLGSGSVSQYYVNNGKDAILKIGSGKITLKNHGYNKITYVDTDKTTITCGGPINGLTFNKTDISKATAVTITSDYNGSIYDAAFSSIVTINASSRTNAVEIAGNIKNNKILGGSNSDVLHGGNGKDSIYGNSGNDSIYGDDGNDKLYGEAGDDTLIGGKGNDTLTGDNGSDVFYYSAGEGNDVIADYTAGEDTIKIGSGVIKSTSMSGNNAVFNLANTTKTLTSNGKITVQKGKDKRITVIDSSGNTITYLNGKTTSASDDDNGGGTVNLNGVTVTLSDSDKSPFKLDDYNAGRSQKAVNIDASAITKSFNIYGDSGANIIKAGGDGYYDTQNIVAGKGDDFIYSSIKARTYFYHDKGDGNDTLYNLKNDDRIILTGAYVSNITPTDAGVILNLDDGSKIAVNDSYGKSINITNLGNMKFAKYSTASNTFTLDKNASGTFDFSKYISSTSTKTREIDATASTNGLTIYGDNSANIIKAGGDGYYDTQNIVAGKGDDFIYSSIKARTYFYHDKGDGNDTLYNLKNDDKIILTGAYINNTTITDSSVILNLDNGEKITLKNSFDKNIYITGLGNMKYTSASNYEEHWFIEEDNYIAGNTDQLTSILQDNNSINVSDNVLGDIINYEMNNILKDNQSKIVNAYSENKNK